MFWQKIGNSVSNRLFRDSVIAENQSLYFTFLPFQHLLKNMPDTLKRHYLLTCTRSSIHRNSMKSLNKTLPSFRPHGGSRHDLPEVYKDGVHNCAVNIRGDRGQW